MDGWYERKSQEPRITPRFLAREIRIMDLSMLLLMLLLPLMMLSL